MQQSDLIDLGLLVINLSSRRVVVREDVVVLRNKEFSLLEYFVKNLGIVLSRTQLLEEVWDRNICCATNTVDVHVSSLRRIFLKHLGANPIKTIHCIGYMFEL